MCDIGGQVRLCGGHGRLGYRRRGRGSGHYTPTLDKNKGLYSALGNKDFNYGQRWASYQMWMTWENIVHQVNTIYGNGISNKLKNKTKVSIPNPEYTEDVKPKQKQRVELLNLESANLSEEM